MIYAIHKATKEHRVISGATRYGAEEWRYVGADPDGWIEWQGGECPLPGGQRVEVEYRDGCYDKGAADQWDICWHDDGSDKDIIAYRPIFDTKVSHPGTMAGPDKYRASAGVWTEPPEWDGEGDKPPVGSRCMKDHAEVLVIAHANVGSLYDPAVVYQPINHPMGIDWKVSNVFSPIRSEEDRVVDQLMMDAELMRVQAERVYAAGYRKTGDT